MKALDWQRLIRKVSAVFLALALVLCAARRSCAFNLDVKFAVVKEGKTSGSLFGFSVAMHEQLVGEKRHLLLVGAPKEKAESGLQANETGDMYACPITADPRDCKRLNLLKSNLDDIPDPNIDVIDGMWLGVSVTSQNQPGGRVMACSHRYVRIISTNYRMIGKCYIRGNNLLYDEGDSQWQSHDEVCNPSGNKDDEGMCLAGMSAAFTQTDVILGAPGCYSWQGNTYIQWHNPKDKYDKRNIKLRDLSRRNIYIGYSVAVDRDLLSKSEETVVSGAPRDEAKGSVILAESVKTRSPEEIVIKASLTGKQVGSYFGNSIAIVDLNNDGWKDLIVGAPFYFDRKMERGGAVYVYMNQNGFFHDEADVTFYGPKNSGFGMSVAAVGDVNQDGFKDFAVGAPYYSTGRIYIWLGNKSGVSQNPSQVIEGKDIAGAGFQTFGYSISGGMDVDRNSYPDVVVGSLDDRVVLIRARPVIHLKKTFSVTPEVIDPNDCDACIEAKVCISYTPSTGGSRNRRNVAFQYTVEADPFNRNPRVYFIPSKDATYTSNMAIDPSGACHSMKLELSRTILDKVAPIVFRLNMSLVEPSPSGGQSLEDLVAFPVVSQEDSLIGRTEIHIQKACGPDNKCESNLQMTATFTDEKNKPFPTQGDVQIFHYSTNVKKLRLVVNVSNVPSGSRKAESAYSALLNVTIPASLSLSSWSPKTMEVDFTANGNLICKLGDPFKSNQREEVEFTFETSGITVDTHEILAELQMSTRSDQNDLRPLSKVLVVEYVLLPTFRVVPSQLRTEFSGKVIGQSAMNFTRDVGSPVEFNFTVDLPGKPLGNMGLLEVMFHWPYAVANEKWLLYLTEIKMIGTSKLLCDPGNGIINPLSLVSEHRSARKRREESSVGLDQAAPQASLNPQGVHRKTVKLECSSASALCHTFACPLSNMATSATLAVKARLWNGTMLEDYTAATVYVLGSATLRLRTDKPTIKMINITHQFSVVIDPAVMEEVPYEAPLWIIIVSVLAGVFLLGFIVILLWKCGFFKRANTRELYEAKALKADLKSQPSENERLTGED